MTATEKRPAGAETISQSEIENLLSQFGAGDAPVAELESAEARPAPRHGAGAHRFPAHSFFSSVELRRLRLRHEELIRYVGAQLASYLRLECVLQMSKLETMPMRQFLETLSDPTHLTLFKLAPLRGVCLLDIPPRLGLCLVDRQLGGAALKVDTSRNLSEIEVRLISRIAELILGEWCSYWSAVVDLRPSLLGCESNGRFVQSADPESAMLVLGVTAWIGGEIMDEMQLAFPHYTLEPLMEKLSAPAQTEAAAAAAPPGRLRWNASLGGLKMKLSVELPATPCTTRQLAQLAVGDLIELQPDAAGQATVRLGGVPKFTGELGVANGRRAVKIKEMISKE